MTGDEGSDDDGDFRDDGDSRDGDSYDGDFGGGDFVVDDVDDVGSDAAVDDTLIGRYEKHRSDGASFPTHIPEGHQYQIFSLVSIL